MKARRKVSTSTIKEYSFTEQSLFIESFLTIHLARIATGCISLGVALSYHDVLEFQSCRYVSLLCIQNRLKHSFMLKIEFKFRSNRYCIHLGLNEKVQYKISRPGIFDQSFFCLTVISIVLGSKISPGLMVRFC